MLLAEHQIAAVARVGAILRRYGGALLADEPGLGKSLIAAAICQEYRAGGAEIEVVVPASLVPQWTETLTQFEVEAALLTHDALMSRRFWPEARLRLMVVDEAHAFRNPQTQRHAALARQSVGARLLLVTATPLCNSLRDLEALVALIAADDAVGAAGVPSIDTAFARRDTEAIHRILGELMVRRGRDALPARLRFGALVPQTVEFDVFSAGGAVDALLESLALPMVGGRSMVRQFLWRRLESSEAALAESLRRQRRFCERALECLSSGRGLPRREYRRAFGREEDLAAVQRVLFWELFVDQDASCTAADLEGEIERLDGLLRLLMDSSREKEQLLAGLIEHLDQPVLVFTGWAATAASLHVSLRGRVRSAVATGRDRAAAAAAIDSFRGARCDVLIATDLAAEGLNLQRAAAVVHYDLPWNPVKVDQRNGRAHRIGQSRAEVTAWSFVARRERTGVARIVASKNEARQRSLRAVQAAGVTPTLRPRLASGSAALALAAVLARRGQELPDCLTRRHRAGVEQLLREVAGEGFDPRKLNDLLALLRFEPWGGGLGSGTPLI